MKARLPLCYREHGGWIALLRSSPEVSLDASWSCIWTSAADDARVFWWVGAVVFNPPFWLLMHEGEVADEAAHNAEAAFKAEHCQDVFRADCEADGEAENHSCDCADDCSDVRVHGTSLFRALAVLVPAASFSAVVFLQHSCLFSTPFAYSAGSPR